MAGASQKIPENVTRLTRQAARRVVYEKHDHASETVPWVRSP
jgi:hypothetical protein